MRYQHFTAEILQFLKKNGGLGFQDIVMIRFSKMMMMMMVSCLRISLDIKNLLRRHDLKMSIDIRAASSYKIVLNPCITYDLSQENDMKEDSYDSK